MFMKCLVNLSQMLTSVRKTMEDVHRCVQTVQALSGVLVTEGLLSPMINPRAKVSFRTIYLHDFIIFNDIYIYISFDINK